MTPYDRFSLVKEDPDKHEKTVFEKFIGYCGKYQPKFYEYRPKRRLNFKDFSIMHAPKKDADWHFERFCRKAGPSLDEQKAMRQVLDGICGKLPEAYGKIFVDRLKREVILLKLEAANEKAKAEMVSKTAKERIAFAKPKDPNGISSSALNGFQRPEKPAQPQPMKR